MQANSDGLSPSLRPFLGVGWNRALPAAFGFGKGIYLNGGNIRVPGLERGWQYTSECSLEFWTKCNAGNSPSMFFIWAQLLKTTTPTAFTNYNVNNGTLGMAGTDNGFQTSVGQKNFNGTKQHIVYTGEGTGYYRIYYNGIYQGRLSGQTVPFTPDVFQLFVSGDAQTSPYDEVRFYDRQLSPEKVALNYNDGLGANPCDTEHLLFWYKFDEFETLDFSPLQDGSDTRLGVRDMSNRNNHGLPLSMDTNPASSTYVLQNF